MNHSAMDHMGHMDHSTMDHSAMDHSQHAGHTMDHSMDSHEHHLMQGSTDVPMVDHSAHAHGSMEHMMSMAFHFGYNETILIEQWSIDSIGGMLDVLWERFSLRKLKKWKKFFTYYDYLKT